MSDQYATPSYEPAHTEPQVLEATFEPPAEAPTVIIPAMVRFALYVASVLIGLITLYAVAKGWAGEAELVLSGGLAALLNTLAAAKVTRDALRVR